MAIDPVTAFILGTCLVACWPCFLPCCLALPILPCPVIIVRSKNGNRDEFKQKAFPTIMNQGERFYYMGLTKRGFVLKKMK